MIIGSTSQKVTITMSPADAHSFGRYLYDVGSRDGDKVAEDGAELVYEAHMANGMKCPEPRDCPFPDKGVV